MSKKFFISAGEASGDLHAAELIAALKSREPDAEFMFLGGDLMAAAAGAPDAPQQPLIHYRQMAFMAFSEVLRNLRTILGNFKRARTAMLRFKPDALILVDYPSFNLKLAKEAHRAGIPVFYYISPKVWAWKQWRVKQIRRYCHKVLSILPFEEEFYRRHNMEVKYVGNPSVEEIDRRIASLGSREEFVKRHGLDPAKPILALVPGSRRGEIRNNLPVMDAVARRFPHLQPVIAGAPAIDPTLYAQFSSFPTVDGETFALMAAADAALVTSGTATLECALLGTPQVVCYRANGSKLSYNIMKRLLSCKWVSLPNLIADAEIIPEQLVHLCTPDLVAARLAPLLSTPSESKETVGTLGGDIRHEETKEQKETEGGSKAAVLRHEETKEQKETEGGSNAAVFRHEETREQKETEGGQSALGAEGMPAGRRAQLEGYALMRSRLGAAGAAANAAAEIHASL